MFVGLIITSVTAYVVSQDPDLYNVILGNDIVFYGLLIAQFLAIISIVAFIKRIPDNLAEITFGLYCFLTGLTLSAIFLEFSISSIAYVVVITAAMFGFMSLYGYVTKTDLTSLGNIAIMALFGIILALIVNLFIMNSVLDAILSILGVLVFSGLTAYDTQNIKNTLMYDDGDLIKKEILGALNLYLDLVNLFLDLIKLLGKRREA
jgi:FtsH-binding integral membrane protein